MTLSHSLKVHLRVLDVRGVTLRVVTLRPQTRVRFSTNYFHDTWHIVSDDHGAAILGRLLWGLAFQHLPGTLVLLDGDHLAPTPFEADPPDPILLVPAGLTSVDVDGLRALKLRLRRAPGAPTTIRWHTFGMPAALALTHAELRAQWRETERIPVRSRERMSRRAGFLCYTAPPAYLRMHGVGIHHMQRGGSYFPLADGDPTERGYDGEFQLFDDFDDRISAAIVARREVLGGVDRALADDAERHAVWARTSDALRRLRAARGAPERT